MGMDSWPETWRRVYRAMASRPRGGRKGGVSLFRKTYNVLFLLYTFQIADESV